MTKLTDDIRKDTVPIKWIRTITGTVTGVLAAGAGLWALAVYVFEPHAVSWTAAVVESVTVKLSGDIEENSALLAERSDQLARLEVVVGSLAASLEDIASVQVQQMEPSWQFSRPDTSISDGQIGDDVIIRAGGFKLRECGVPLVDIYFRDSQGAYHRFTDNSLLTDTGRGVPFPVNPNMVQTVAYTAEIPSDQVAAGRAAGFISVTYPQNCPQLLPVVIGDLQFMVLPADEPDLRNISR